MTPFHLSWQQVYIPLAIIANLTSLVAVVSAAITRKKVNQLVKRLNEPPKD
jgi:hypothetical protein